MLFRYQNQKQISVNHLKSNMMKKYINKISLILLLSLCVSACTQEEVETYSADDSVYFTWAVEGTGATLGTSKKDSLSTSFAFHLPDIVLDTFNVPIKTQGFVVDYNRSVKIEALTSSSAIKGTHFNIPTSVIIPADSINGVVPIYLFRTPDMKEKVLSIKIKLVPNGHFNTNIVGEDEELSFDEFELTISDILVEPLFWTQFGYRYLGTFSIKKFYLFAEVNNMPVPDYDTEGNPPLSVFYAQALNFRAYLNEQTAAGTPVYEEDGSLMTWN